jgi:hypothetical protein
MAKVKRKRDMSLVANVGQDATELPTLAESIQAREMMKESKPIPTVSTGPIGPGIPSAVVGSMGGPIGTIESTAKPVERPAAKAKVVKKASASAAVPAASKEKAMPSEPLSPQSWVNQGNQPSAYKDYLASWNAQNASKKVKVKKKG